MKRFLRRVSPAAFVSTFVFAAAISFAAQTNQSKTQNANLDEFNFSGNWQSMKSVDSGSLTIDSSKKELTLTLIHRGSCRKNMCTPSAIPPEVITVPIVETKDDICGIKIIEGKKDMRATDGPVETVIVQDYSNFNCQSVRPTKPTRAALHIEGGWSPVAYHADIGGEALK